MLVVLYGYTRVHQQLISYLWTDLRDDTKVDLNPLGNRLIFGTPSISVWLVYSSEFLSTFILPLDWVCGWRRDLPISYIARNHTERTRTSASCVQHTHTCTINIGDSNSPSLSERKFQSVYLFVTLFDPPEFVCSMYSMSIDLFVWRSSGVCECWGMTVCVSLQFLPIDIN